MHLKFSRVIVVASLLMTQLSFSSNFGRVIYGEDNQVDPSQSNDSKLAELSRSVAGMVAKSKMNKEGSIYQTSLVTLEKDILEDFPIKMCESERFSQEKVLPVCTGFLVTEDILVTAGHCIKSKNDCNKYFWVFGYTIENSLVVPEMGIEESNVYSCKEIIETKLEGTNDYAVIRLDREVENREPLRFRNEGSVAVGTPLAVIGHPSGLPLKVADGAEVRSEVKEGYFYANLDTYGGNSGSPVFNHETYEVEGILVRGEQDYVYDSKNTCVKSNYVSNDVIESEGVSDIQGVPFLRSL